MRPTPTEMSEIIVSDAMALVTAYVIEDRTAIDQLLGESGDPEMSAALGSLAASLVTNMADLQRRVPLVMWSETLMARALMN